MELIILLVILASIVGWALKVAAGIWFVGKIVRHYSQLYQMQYLPQVQQFQNLLSQIQLMSAPQQHVFRPQVEVAFQDVNRTFAQLPQEEQRVARPDLQRLRSQWKRLNT